MGREAAAVMRLAQAQQDAAMSQVAETSKKLDQQTKALQAALSASESAEETAQLVQAALRDIEAEHATDILAYQHDAAVERQVALEAQQTAFDYQRAQLVDQHEKVTAELLLRLARANGLVAQLERRVREPDKLRRRLLYKTNYIKALLTALHRLRVQPERPTEEQLKEVLAIKEQEDTEPAAALRHAYVPPNPRDDDLNCAACNRPREEHPEKG